ncbi:MAG: hypothetical protein H7210_00545 [Pyrinomonadaceae bacterium]|nr:hypothetical protein [Phycisphaerales bacterium]
MKQGTFRILGYCAVSIAGMTAAAHARQPEIIYTKISGHPTAVVPGAVDLAGQPVFTEWRALEDFAFSPDGSRWVIKGRTQLGSDLETILVSGQGAVGTMLAQEGQPIPGGAPGEVFDFFGSGLGRWNTLNQFAYSARARGGIASVFQKVIVSDQSGSDIVLQMGDPILGLVDQSPNPSGDETFGNSVGSVHILDNGVIGTQDSTILSIHTSRRPAIMYNGSAFHQANVTMVTSLNGAGTETWKSIAANTFYTTPDGAHWVAEGTVNQSTATDAVLVVDGQVRLQEGMLIPGSTVTMNAIFANGVTAGGVWFARGDQAGGNDWAVVSGTVVARTGDPVANGNPEAWGAVFAALAASDAGDWVLAGITDHSDPATNEVIVLNGERVLLREGDQVDLDGDGTLDDAFIGRGNNTLSAFEPNDLFLTGDGLLYCFANLRNAAGQDLNSTPVFGTPQAFMVLPVNDGPICSCDWNADGFLNSQDFFDFTVAFFGDNSDFNNDGVTNSQDYFDFLQCFFAPPKGCK